jgi:hypothetical protein
MMDNQFLAAPRQGRVRLLVGGAALALAFGAGLVVRIGPHGNDTRHPAAAAPHAAPPPASAAFSGSAAPSASSGAAAPSSPGPMRLIRGSRKEHGVWIGYPHNLAGAVSASVEFSTAITSNLDLQRAVDIGTLITDGSYGPAEIFTQGPISIRKVLGVTTAGPVPTGASAVCSPVAYQVRDVTDDSLTVLVLAFYTLRSDVVGYKSYIAVFPSHMVWTGGDWKDRMRPDGSPEFAELRLQPGSAEAAAAGWLDLLQ